MRYSGLYCSLPEIHLPADGQDRVQGGRLVEYKWAGMARCYVRVDMDRWLSLELPLVLHRLYNDLPLTWYVTLVPHHLLQLE